MGRYASTMPTNSTFKKRVRARMAETGESYVVARTALLREQVADEPTVTNVESAHFVENAMDNAKPREGTA